MVIGARTRSGISQCPLSDEGGLSFCEISPTVVRSGVARQYGQRLAG